MWTERCTVPDGIRYSRYTGILYIVYAYATVSGFPHCLLVPASPASPLLYGINIFIALFTLQVEVRSEVNTIANILQSDVFGVTSPVLP